MTIKQTIDQMQIARSAAACADGELPRQVRLGAGGEGRDFLVSDMQPLDLPLPADSIGQTIEAVPDDPVNALHPRGGEGLDELISHSLCHGWFSAGYQRPNARPCLPWFGSFCSKSTGGRRGPA